MIQQIHYPGIHSVKNRKESKKMKQYILQNNYVEGPDRKPKRQ